MNVRAAALVEALRLRAHPEGGFFGEFFRSPRAVVPADGRGARSALTGIHFLLVAGTPSRWHRLRSDEVWIHLEGGPVRLWLMAEGEGAARSLEIGAAAEDREPSGVVPADTWQAAEPLGEYALVACVVEPGFAFDDFRLMCEDAGARALLRARRADLTRLL